MMTSQSCHQTTKIVKGKVEDAGAKARDEDVRHKVQPPLPISDASLLPVRQIELLPSSHDSHLSPAVYLVYLVHTLFV
jgi:hypothetical protein